MHMVCKDVAIYINLTWVCKDVAMYVMLSNRVLPAPIHRNSWRHELLQDRPQDWLLQNEDTSRCCLSTFDQRVGTRRKAKLVNEMPNIIHECFVIQAEIRQKRYHIIVLA